MPGKQPTVSTDSVAQDQIRAFFERWHRLEEEKRAISEDLKELFAEAKGNGFDTKVLRRLFRDKVGDHAERMEFEALYDIYAAALGMGPLIDAEAEEEPRARPARSAREIIEEFEANLPLHDEDGVIIEEATIAENVTVATESAPPAEPEVAAATAGQGGTEPAALPADNHVQEGSEPIEAHNLDRDGSTPSPATSIEAPRGVEGEAEGASASPANSETPGAGAPAAAPTAHPPISAAVRGDGLYSFDWLRRHGRCLEGENCKPVQGRVCVACSHAMFVVPATAHVPHEGPVT